jgi:hypothetical protein
MRLVGIGLGLALGAGVVLAGCEGAVFRTSTGDVASVTCTEIAGAACTDQVELISARHPGAAAVELWCTARPCDRRGGSGTARVTLAGGTRLDDVFSYVGAQGADPPPVCKGLADDTCRSIARDQLDGISPSMIVAGIEITCSVAECGEDRGEVDVTITLADGSTREGTQGWEPAGR